MNTHKPIILILTDGRPGHETQSIGIAKILNYDQSYEIHFLKIRQPSKFFKQICKKAYSWLPKFWMLKHFISDEQVQYLSTEQNVQYIVSAGGDTLLPNALLKTVLSKKYSNLKNLIATSLRGMPESAYDVVFTIDQAKENQKPYVFYPIAPNKMITFDLEQSKKSARNNLLVSDDQCCITILIGADTKEVKIGLSDEWVDFISNLSITYPNYIFYISTSRRTLEDFEKKLTLNLSYENIKLVLFSDKELVPIQEMIYAADVVICSPDSTSMVSESIISRKKVIVPIFKTTLMNKEFEQYYRGIQSYVKLAEADQSILQKIENIEGEEHDHVQELSKKIHFNLESKYNWRYR